MRRATFDPLEISNSPMWYVVRSMHNVVLEVRPLPAGADLKRAFVAAMLEWIDAGWKLSEFSSRTGVLFCTRGTARRMVEISPTDHGPARGRALG
jgi:hypothetical protein